MKSAVRRGGCSTYVAGPTSICTSFEEGDGTTRHGRYRNAGQLALSVLERTVGISDIERGKPKNRGWMTSNCWGGLITIEVGWVKKSTPPLRFSCIVFPKGWEFLVQILRAYYTFLSELDYENFQLSATLNKLCHIKCDHHHMLKTSAIGRNACWMVAFNMA